MIIDDEQEALLYRLNASEIYALEQKEKQRKQVARGTGSAGAIAVLIAKYPPHNGTWRIEDVGELGYYQIAQTLGYFNPLAAPETYRPPLQVPNGE